MFGLPTSTSVGQANVVQRVLYEQLQVRQDVLDVLGESTCYYNGFCDLPYPAVPPKMAGHANFVIVIATQLGLIYLAQNDPWESAAGCAGL